VELLWWYHLATNAVGAAVAAAVPVADERMYVEVWGMSRSRDPPILHVQY
jgi:hypothetical protein